MNTKKRNGWIMVGISILGVAVGVWLCFVLPLGSPGHADTILPGAILIVVSGVPLSIGASMIKFSHTPY